MDFSEFIRHLHPVIGAGNSTSAFTRSILEMCLTEEGQCVLEGYGDSTFKAYFNGNTKITKSAQKMTPYLDTYDFEQYILQFPETTLSVLCSSFKPFCPNINESNIAEALADNLIGIIKEAARAKRKSPASSEDAEPIEAEVVDDEMPSGAAEEDKKITVIQRQTNVVQNGEKNFNLTNNGTMNFNF